MPWPDIFLKTRKPPPKPEPSPAEAAPAVAPAAPDVPAASPPSEVTPAALSDAASTTPASAPGFVAVTPPPQPGPTPIPPQPPLIQPVPSGATGNPTPPAQLSIPKPSSMDRSTKTIPALHGVVLRPPAATTRTPTQHAPLKNIEQLMAEADPVKTLSQTGSVRLLKRTLPEPHTGPAAGPFTSPPIASLPKSAAPLPKPIAPGAIAASADAPPITPAPAPAMSVPTPPPFPSFDPTPKSAAAFPPASAPVTPPPVVAAGGLCAP